jgi:hypothetical protein
VKTNKIKDNKMKITHKWQSPSKKGLEKEIKIKTNEATLYFFFIL